MNQEDIKYFQRFGFIQYKGLLSPEEIVVISDAFDEGMRVARKGAPAPKSGEKRQQIIPFFDYDPEVFYPLLDHEKIVDIFEGLMGEDFILTLSEGIIHTGGSGWHHDAYAPEGYFSMRAAIYLDPLGPEDGCLTVIPGSHFREFGEAINKMRDELGGLPNEMPGRYPLCNEPGDVLFMNHKTYHAALSDKYGRRAIHINCVPNTTPETNQEHFDWLMMFLAGETKHWGRFYSDRLISTAGPRRQKMLERAIELGLGNTGPITQLQDLR